MSSIRKSSSRTAETRPPGSLRSPPPEGAVGGSGRPRAADLEPPGSRCSPPPKGAVGSSRRPRAADLDPSAVDHLLGYLLALAEVPTRRAFQQHVGQPFDLRPVEFSLLVLLLANGQAAPQQIGRVLRLPPPHVTTLVNRLAERGLVQRGRDPHDGRAVCVTLSAPGQGLAERLRAVSLTMESGVQAVLSPAEQSQLKRLLQKLARAPG